MLMQIRRVWRLPVVICLLLAGVWQPALADCEVNGASATNGTAADDLIVCDNDPSPPTTTAVGGGSGGNDTIIINNDNASTVTGDGDVVSAIAISQAAVAGADTIIINGMTSAIVLGDAMLPGISGAGDTITINGRAYFVYGDYVSGTATGGDDTITVNGTVESWVIGDYQWTGAGGDTFTGGNDHIIINGTISSGGVTGDRAAGTGTRIGGDDTIIIGGTATVNGVVEGDRDVTVGGNDHIIVEVGATIVGTISGGNVAGDFDILTFTGSTSDQGGFAQLQALVGCNPCSGTVTIDGHIYTFANFEQLENLLTLVDLSSAAPVLITLNAEPGPVADNLLDGRINNSPTFDVAAPAAVYCMQDGGFDVYAIDPVSGGSTLVALVTGEHINAMPPLTEAYEVLGEGSGVTVYRLLTGGYQVNAVTADGKSYVFAWDACPPTMRDWSR